MTNKLQYIDEFLRSDHYYLEEGDNCYFYGEYTARMGFSYSEMNDLILNFKKSINKKGTDEWRYKDLAINHMAKTLTSLNAWNTLKKYTWIPMPPSKTKDHPLYDDRLIKTLEIFKSREPSLDFRELVKIDQSRKPAHDLETRPKPQDHIKNFRIDQDLLNPKPLAIAIFDDIITTGAGFKAMKHILSNTFKGINIIGVFMARTTRDAEII